MKLIILMAGVLLCFFSIQGLSKTHYVYLNGKITATTYKKFPQPNHVYRGDTVKVIIGGSPGGLVRGLYYIIWLDWEYRKKGVTLHTHVQRYAYSAAAVIYMMGQVRTHNRGAELMFHRPWTQTKDKGRYTFCERNKMSKYQKKISRMYLYYMKFYGIERLLKSKGEWQSFLNCRDIYIDL